MFWKTVKFLFILPFALITAYFLLISATVLFGVLAVDGTEVLYSAFWIGLSLCFFIIMVSSLGELEYKYKLIREGKWWERIFGILALRILPLLVVLMFLILTPYALFEIPSEAVWIAAAPFLAWAIFVAIKMGPPELHAIKEFLATLHSHRQAPIEPTSAPTSPTSMFETREIPSKFEESNGALPEESLPINPFDRDSVNNQFIRIYDTNNQITGLLSSYLQEDGHRVEIQYDNLNLRKIVSIKHIRTDANLQKYPLSAYGTMIKEEVSINNWHLQHPSARDVFSAGGILLRAGEQLDKGE